jgi:hypothetical protein
MFSTPRKHFFFNFLGVPFAENHKTHINSNYPNYYFSPFFSLYRVGGISLVVFNCVRCSKKKNWNGGNRVGLQTPHEFRSKIGNCSFFSHFFALNCFFVCACYFYKTNKKCGNSLKTYLIRFSFVPVKRNLQCVSIIIQFSLDILFELKSTRVCICVY